MHGFQAGKQITIEYQIMDTDNTKQLIMIDKSEKYAHSVGVN